MPTVTKNTEEYQSLKKEFEEARVDIREIKDCLLGNEFSQGKGLVADVIVLEARLRAIEETITKYKWILFGLAFGSGVGVTSLLTAIVDAFTKHKIP